MDTERIEELAVAIRELMLEHGVWMDTTIYFNGKAFSTDDGNGHYFYNDRDHLIVLENENPHDYFDYAGGVLSMSFEGAFYEAMNYGYMRNVLREFDELINSFGCYYELGNMWNLSVYEI